MNRGRHHHQMDEIAKLAKKYGAKYPKAWSKGITYNTLVKLINTQKKRCGFNNLNIFETNYTSSTISRGGFIWDNTEEGHIFWSKCLGNLYDKVQKYKNELYKI